MSLVDATDGVLMLGAYGWAYIKPIRKLYYNLNITLVSVLIAFVIGGIEVLSIIGDKFGLTGGIWDWVGRPGLRAHRRRDHRHLRGQLGRLDPHLPLEGLRRPAGVDVRERFRGGTPESYASPLPGWPGAIAGASATPGR